MNDELMSKRIKNERINKGLTQTELGNKLGLSLSSIQKYESGIVSNMKRSTIEGMANIFDVTPSYLMGMTNERNIIIKEEPIINNVWLSFAKEAEAEGIDPEDIKAAIELIKKLKNKKDKN